ncbi:hypothetical protein [Candidatus Venteria ishoeyi]|uniref:DUF4276 family protein n=1 Tax=Candidatus Venteria ishoeyi TaxID=1899563 RepID=A0A1H6FGA2_9GAMM|nr:hypothetical protein [Candidatus Venteria ishoeyi]MDM8547548.1 hypothetical protein [Candidatus Venteria ishoeyi]SEH08369.1 Uncharacterised protein [Candidatus Venteria ishoeyi]
MEKELEFLLVCEGPTDIAFLKNLTAKIGAQFNTAINIRELAPQRDATTGRYPPFGWTKVKAWCELYCKPDITEQASTVPQTYSHTYYWKALLLDSDGLIIQMDTDIAEKITDFTTHFDENYLGTRRDFCNEAILYWLNETQQTIDKAYLLLPSFAIETWLLASHDPGDVIFQDLEQPFDYEALSDFEDRLVNHGYSSRFNNRKNKPCLEKKKELYTDYANTVFAQLDNILTRCQEANKYYQFLSENCQNN